MSVPNQLSQEAVEAFQAIYLAEFGIQLSEGEAQDIGLRMLQFFDFLLRQDLGDKS